MKFLSGLVTLSVGLLAVASPLYHTHNSRGRSGPGAQPSRNEVVIQVLTLMAAKDTSGIVQYYDDLAPKGKEGAMSTFIRGQYRKEFKELLVDLFGSTSLSREPMNAPVDMSLNKYNELVPAHQEAIARTIMTSGLTNEQVEVLMNVYTNAGNSQGAPTIQAIFDHLTANQKVVVGASWLNMGMTPQQVQDVATIWRKINDTRYVRFTTAEIQYYNGLPDDMALNIVKIAMLAMDAPDGVSRLRQYVTLTGVRPRSIL